MTDASAEFDLDDAPGGLTKCHEIDLKSNTVMTDQPTVSGTLLVEYRPSGETLKAGLIVDCVLGLLDPAQGVPEPEELCSGVYDEVVGALFPDQDPADVPLFVSLEVAPDDVPDAETTVAVGALH